MGAEPDVTKKRKKRRSARFYISTAHPLPTPEQIAALATLFPPDDPGDDEDQAPARTRRMVKPDAEKRDYSQSERRRLASQGHALPSGAYPIADTEDLHNAAVLARTGHGDAEAAKKLIRRRAKELGVPVPDLGDSAEKSTMGNPHQPGGRDLSAARVSPSRVVGNAAVAVDDHGGKVDPMNMPGPRELAWRHPDMRQGTTNPVPLLSMRTDDTAFPRDLRGMVPGVSVALSRLDAYSAAGAPDFRVQPSGNPAMRQGPHIAPIGASNGSHSLSDPVSHAVANKNTGPLRGTAAVDAMKQAMFGGGQR